MFFLLLYNKNNFVLKALILYIRGISHDKSDFSCLGVLKHLLKYQVNYLLLAFQFCIYSYFISICHANSSCESQSLLRKFTCAQPSNIVVWYFSKLIQIVQQEYKSLAPMKFTSSTAVLVTWFIFKIHL